MKNIRVFLTLVLCMAATCGFAQNFSDNFEVRRMDAEHFHLWDNDASIVNMGTRGMTIMAKGDSPKNANIVYYNATDDAWEAEANIILYPTSEAGLVLMNSRDEYWGITATYGSITVRTADNTVKTVKNPCGRYIRLRLTYADGKLTVAYGPGTAAKVVANGNPAGQRTQGKNFRTLETLDVKKATRIALTSAKKDVMSVRDFWYNKK